MFCKNKLNPNLLSPTQQTTNQNRHLLHYDFLHINLYTLQYHCLIQTKYYCLIQTKYSKTTNINLYTLQYHFCIMIFYTPKTTTYIPKAHHNPHCLDPPQHMIERCIYNGCEKRLNYLWYSIFFFNTFNNNIISISIIMEYIVEQCTNILHVLHGYQAHIPG